MKDKITAALLAIFLGGLGIHKFYLNRPLQGVIYLLFCWTFIPSIVSFIEGLIYLCMSNNSFNNKYNRLPNQPIYNNIYLSSNQNVEKNKPSQIVYNSKNICPKTQSEAFYFILIKISQLDGDISYNECLHIEAILKTFFNDSIINLNSDFEKIKSIMNEDTFSVIDKSLEFVDDNEKLLAAIIKLCNEDNDITEEEMNIIRYVSKKQGIPKTVYMEIINQLGDA